MPISVAQAAGGELDDVVKLTILMADLADFGKVNEIMAAYFGEPYPARATVGVARRAPPGAGRGRRGIHLEIPVGIS